MASLATLGDQLMSAGKSNWRAELREAGIATRLPPKDSRPDRGYVEQPEERVEKSETRVAPPSATLSSANLPMRRVITFEQLEKYSEAPDELLEAVTAPTVTNEAEPIASTTEDEALFQEEPGDQTEASPPVEREVRRREWYSLEFKVEAVARVDRGEKPTLVADSLGISKSVLSYWCQGRGMKRDVLRSEADQRVEERENEMAVHKFDEQVRGTAIARVLKGEAAADVARDLDINPKNLYNWLARHRSQHGKRLPKGFENVGPSSAIQPVSNGHATPSPTLASPPSRAFGEMPPAPSLRIDGLEAYINALIDRRVAEAVKAELRKRLAGD